MAVIVFDKVGERFYETGVDHGVLYMPDEFGLYSDGVAWNGLYTVTEKPTGAEANPQYADNIKYLNLYSLEEFAATIEAFTYPNEFAAYDGLGVPSAGVMIGQQPRKPFGLSYRSRIGNDLEADSLGYKLHLVWGAYASPSEKAYATVSDSPEAITFSWELTTTPVAVTGYKPTSSMTIDSRLVDEDSLSDLEDLLYGTVGTDPSLPLPDDVVALFAGTVVNVIPVQPAFDTGTNTITIPTVVGLTYYIDAVAQSAGDVVISANTVVTAHANPGYHMTPGYDDDWFFEYTP